MEGKETIREKIIDVLKTFECENTAFAISILNVIEKAIESKWIPVTEKSQEEYSDVLYQTEEYIEGRITELNLNASIMLNHDWAQILEFQAKELELLKREIEGFKKDILPTPPKKGE